MALIDSATLTIDRGNFYRSPVGTDIPDDLDVAPGTPWVDLGNTSLEEPFAITSEGGEATTLGTLQNRTLRTRYSTRQDTFGITLQQFDAASIKLFFGSNMVDLTSLRTGLLGVHETPTATEAGFLAIFIDAEQLFAIYAPKAEFFRSDDPSFGTDDALSGLPISVKPVKSGSNRWTYAVTPLLDLDA